jgi:hypothetical protein
MLFPDQDNTFTGNYSLYKRATFILVTDVAKACKKLSFELLLDSKQSSIDSIMNLRT